MTLLHERDRKKSFSYNTLSYDCLDTFLEVDVTELFHMSYLRVLSEGHTKTNG